MNEAIQTIFLREDSKLIPMKLKVDEMARNIITRRKRDKRLECYLLIHQLMKPVFNFPGIKDGTKTLLICSRDVRFDPLNELDESWDKDHIRARLKEAAKEQQHKAEQSKTGQVMSSATLILAGCAALVFVLIFIVGAAKSL